MNQKKKIMKLIALCMAATFVLSSVSACTATSYGAETTVAAEESTQSAETADETTAQESVEEASADSGETEGAKQESSEDPAELSFGITEAKMEKKTYPYVKMFDPESKEEKV